MKRLAEGAVSAVARGASRSGMRAQCKRSEMSRFPLAVVTVVAVVVMGCQGEPIRNVQRDVDSVRSEVAAVSRTNEGQRGFVEERLGKLEADLKGRLERSENARIALLGRVEREERARMALEKKLGEAEAALPPPLD